MSPQVKSFLQRWLVTTLGVLVAANVVGGIRYDTVTGLLLASLLLGILNAVVRPVMLLLSLPLLIVTLGLFVLVINAVLLYVVGALLKTFHVESFWAAIAGGIVISVVSFFANLFLGNNEARARVHRGRPPSPPPSDGGGPIIDV